MTNPMLGKGYRIAAGKLRLCIQASLRWDALQRTPFMNVEWVRRTGENRIIGLRSKFGDSKTGPRPWVASYLGVSEEGDDWLPVLVHLLMESHGEGWRLHDHIGKSYNSEGDIAKTAVASFDQDVQFIRCMLSSALEEGVDLGMTSSQAKTSRWHGAKSTLTSVMMHRQVGDRAVRFAGNWKECRESMPDTYLRESQLLVLAAQEKALHYLRSGGDIGSLEGVPLEFGQTTEVGGDLKEGSVKVSDPPEGWRVQGLEVREVVPGVLEEALSHGPLNEETLETEKAQVVDLEAFKDILTAESVEGGEDEEWKAPSQERSSDVESSGDEFYLDGYLRVAKTISLGTLHKPSPADANLPRCGQKAKGFEFVGAGDALERKATFCVKCFGKANGCNKLCSVVKFKEIDGEKVASRCSRRCERSCPSSGYTDTDDRVHRCYIHEENEVSGEV